MTDNTGVVHDHLAINIEKVLNAAPTLKNFPDLVLAVAQGSGDIEDNAQAVGALHLISAIAWSTSNHVQDNPEAYTNLIKKAGDYHNQAAQ